VRGNVFLPFALHPPYWWVFLILHAGRSASAVMADVKTEVFFSVRRPRLCNHAMISLDPFAQNMYSIMKHAYTRNSVARCIISRNQVARHVRVFFLEQECMNLGMPWHGASPSARCPRMFIPLYISIFTNIGELSEAMFFMFHSFSFEDHWKLVSRRSGRS
jgi:hypothetical protein